MIKRQLRCAHPGCDVRPTSPSDGHLFHLGDKPAAWVCAEHADNAEALVEKVTEVAVEGARLVVRRIGDRAAKGIAAFLFGD